MCCRVIKDEERIDYSTYKKERKRKWEKEEELERYNHHKRRRISHHRRRQKDRVRESNGSDVRRRRVAEGYGKYAVSERGRDSFGNKYILNEKSSGWAPVSCRNNEEEELEDGEIPREVGIMLPTKEEEELVEGEVSEERCSCETHESSYSFGSNGRKSNTKSERLRESSNSTLNVIMKKLECCPESCHEYNGGIRWDYIASRKHEDQDLLLRKAFFSKKMDFVARELAHLLSEEPFNSVEVKCNITAVEVEVPSKELCQEKKHTIISCCHGSEQLDVVSECGEQLENYVSPAKDKESSVLEFEDQEFSSETVSTTSSETCIVELPNGVAHEVSQYQQLFENWVPPVMDCTHLESEDLEWLFETKFVRAPGTRTVEIANAKTEKLSNLTSTFIPRAQYLPHAEMNALLFTVPF